MLAIVMGAATTPKKVLAALPSVQERRLRKAGGRVWVALPHDTSSRTIDRLARKLHGNVRVVEVEMPLGLRGSEMTAATYIAPGREDEDDLTDVASETFDAWMEDSVGGAFDEDVAAQELAWALVEMIARTMREESG